MLYEAISFVRLWNLDIDDSRQEQVNFYRKVFSEEEPENQVNRQKFKC